MESSSDCDSGTPDEVSVSAGLDVVVCEGVENGISSLSKIKYEKFHLISLEYEN